MRVERRVVVPLPTDLAFAVMETVSGGPRWLRPRGHFLDGATEPAPGVRCEVRAPLRPRMVMGYTAYDPPHKAVVKVIRGPWVVPDAACGIGFSAVAAGTEVTMRYSLRVRPKFIGPLTNWPVARLLERTLDRYLAAYGSACLDDDVVTTAKAKLSQQAE